ncbi:TetR/AcrR family transcriptional regulator [Kitasatospora sp. NPDC059812]|uniref:TetR/AcrR family transcriptional regulator n=1 Tax=Kitasatospora sp. NPDC059812 TaxID=3346958 RepID=UPI00364C03D2
MPRLTDTRKELRRTQITEAAVRCFSRNGLERTSIADITAESGLSAGSIYAHYRSKADLVHASAHALLAERAEALGEYAASDGPPDPDELLTRLIATIGPAEARVGVQTPIQAVSGPSKSTAASGPSRRRPTRSPSRRQNAPSAGSARGRPAPLSRCPAVPPHQLGHHRIQQRMRDLHHLGEDRRITRHRPPVPEIAARVPARQGVQPRRPPHRPRAHSGHGGHELLAAVRGPPQSPTHHTAATAGAR